ncbi:hypothetical protein Nepgr_025383 [Nepenthes gracilis]|uniref:Uncharacterized protein n=1 Tax=Nepenthes gracilis TaxID=150966 RepID=A0AAD3T508_NEPGR|nr:hypothetical protein Nepgr_025383 [Nepenthes gracilis]
MQYIGMPLMIHFSDDGEAGGAGRVSCLPFALWIPSMLIRPSSLAVYLKWLLGVPPNLSRSRWLATTLELVAEFTVLLARFLFLICNEWQSSSYVDEQSRLPLVLAPPAFERILSKILD